VAKAYLQQIGFDYKETYAPVANIITIKTLLCVINQQNLYMCQLDVKTAFLNEQLVEEIYMEQPQGFVGNSSLVCKLHKTIYGLKQAPKWWKLEQKI